MACPGGAAVTAVAERRAGQFVVLAIVVAIGLDIADPLIGLAITVVILRITWDSWRTITGRHDH